MSEQSVGSTVRLRRPISGLEKRRNAAMDRAATINPVTLDHACAAPLLRIPGITTAGEYCSMSAESKKHAARLDKMPSLLVADPLKPNEFVMVGIGRRAPVAPECITGMCWMDVRGGIPILVPENTIVYWR